MLLSAIRNIKIQTRLIGSFFILSLLPLLVTGMISYSGSSSAIKSKISTYSVQIADQVGKNIEWELSRLEYDSVDLGISETVQNSLKNYPEMGEFEKYNSSFVLQESVVKKFSFLRYVSDVLLYTNSKDRIIAYGDDNMFNFVLEQDYLENLVSAADAKNGAPVWQSVCKADEVHFVERVESAKENRYGILLCRGIKDLSTSNQTGYRSNGTKIGYIVIRTSESYLSDIFKNIDIGEGADIFVVDSKGVVISSRNPEIAITKKYKSGDISAFIRNVTQSGAHTVRFAGDREDSLVAFSPIRNTDWFVVNVIPFSYLNGESVKAGRYTLIVGVICFILAALLSFFISKSISLPLKKLISSMNEAKKGNLSSTIADGSRDEIAEVTSNHNAMLYEVKMLMENIQYKEKQKRIAELKTLQAQINPHFLSNTLNTAKWLAGIQNAENIENLLTALIELLHASIGKGDELITLREEIHYLNNYIAIQEYKYCDKFEVHFEIQPELLDLKILKSLLQPLVENSIIHGIEPMEGKGVIVVKASVEENILRIKISDNGVGMPEDVIKAVLSEDSRSSKSRFCGIGVSNVEERIKLFFGEEYGIHLESVPYLFTTIELTLPVIGEVRESC